MTIPTISQVISVIETVKHRDTINPTIPATQDDFVNSVETFFDTISDTTVGELNTLKTEINTTVSAMNTVADEVENNANIAAAVGNYQGEWSNSVTYSKSQGVSVGDLYYISKVNSNLNHAVTDTNYWIPNPINDKLDKDFSTLTSKTTPTDTDVFSLWDGAIKKVSWVNIKATLKSYFDTFYVALSGNQTMAGLKTFSDGLISTSAVQPIGYAAGAGGTVTQSTSKSTAVTLNKPCGQITMNNATLAAGASVQFNLFNSLIGANDTVCIMLDQSSSTVPVLYSITPAVSTGLCQIGIRNNHTASLSESIKLIFTIIKGATAW